MAGKLVKHEDGRRGIVYNQDQLPKLEKQDKVVVQFVNKQMKPDGPKRAVKAEKLTQIGFVD